MAVDAPPQPGYAVEEPGPSPLPPIGDAEKFLCVGKNYRSHLKELEANDLIKEKPEEPTGFIKLNACLTGHDTDVERPATVSRLDYEPELVFVIARTAPRCAPRACACAVRPARTWP